MERFNGENHGETRLTSVDKVEFDKDLLLRKIEEYCYLPKEDFSEKDAETLAAMESYDSAPKEFSDWDNKKERKRCEIKKNLEHTILKKKNPTEAGNYLDAVKEKYCNGYVKTRKNTPNSDKKRKKKTILDPDIFYEAEDSFKKSLSGIENEIIARKILEKSGLATRTASSKLDMINKIDLFCSDGKLLIAMQVKGRFCKDPKNYNGKIFKELVSANPSEQDENKFLKGCESFERESKIKGQEINLIKIWINIPSGYKTREFGGYDERLEKEIIEGLEKALKSLLSA